MPPPHVVLVVEPHGEVRDRVVRALAGRYSIYTAISAADALAVLGSIEPVVIVCGVALGELDAAAFVRRARAAPNGRRAKFIALVDHAHPLDLIHAIQAGVRRCIEQDRDPEALRRAVDQFDGAGDLTSRGAS